MSAGTGTLDAKVLKELIEGSGVSFRSSNISWILTCPRCSKRDKLYIRKRDGRFICWLCATTEGFQGRAEYGLHELLGMPIKELQERLYGSRGSELAGPAEIYLPPLSDFFDDADDAPYDLIPPLEQGWPLDFFPILDPSAKRGREYLAGRGISPELAEAEGLRYHPRERRVIFPIMVDQRLIGWQARYIEETEYVNEEGETKKIPKILTSPTGLDRRRCLMGQDGLKGQDHAVVVEGPIDRIKAHLCGGAVATMGKSVSGGQLEVLKSSGVRSVYLGLDPDAMGEMARLCQELGDIQLYNMTPARGFDDFGAMTPEAVLMRFLNATPISGAELFVPPLLDTFFR